MISLCAWYRNNKRSYPWRDSGDPYDVWISEIMLQQTRIEAVIPKFIAFKQGVADIASLAAIDDDRLLKLWEGLGYYSRARNLKKCASILMDQYGGQLPCDYDQLLKLPGIGPYTAGAILSIGFHLPYPAVDGNVMRILSRMLNIQEDVRQDSTRKQMEDIISAVLADDQQLDPADVTQSLMELGQTICLPHGVPNCAQCPFASSCYACLNRCTDALPCRSSLNKRKIVNRTLIILREDDAFLLHKRAADGLLANMYEFIGYDGHLSEKEVYQACIALGYSPLSVQRKKDAVHIFTHMEWHMQAYEVFTENLKDEAEKRLFVFEREKLKEIAIPSAFALYKKYYGI